MKPLIVSSNGLNFGFLFPRGAVSQSRDHCSFPQYITSEYVRTTQSIHLKYCSCSVAILSIVLCSNNEAASTDTSTSAVIYKDIMFDRRTVGEPIRFEGREDNSRDHSCLIASIFYCSSASP